MQRFREGAEIDDAIIGAIMMLLVDDGVENDQRLRLVANVGHGISFQKICIHRIKI